MSGIQEKTDLYTVRKRIDVCRECQFFYRLPFSGSNEMYVCEYGDGIIMETMMSGYLNAYEKDEFEKSDAPNGCPFMTELSLMEWNRNGKGNLQEKR